MFEPEEEALPLQLAVAAAGRTSSESTTAFLFLDADSLLARLLQAAFVLAFALPLAFALARGWAFFFSSCVSAASRSRSSSSSVGGFPAGSFNADNLMSKSPCGNTSDDFTHADV